MKESKITNTVLLEVITTRCMVKKRIRLDIRKYSFSQRTINVWNTLSTDCVHANNRSSVERSRTEIDTWVTLRIRVDFT